MIVSRRPLKASTSCSNEGLNLRRRNSTAALTSRRLSGIRLHALCRCWHVRCCCFERGCRCAASLLPIASSLHRVATDQLICFHQPAKAATAAVEGSRTSVLDLYRRCGPVKTIPRIAVAYPCCVRVCWRKWLAYHRFTKSWIDLVNRTTFTCH